MCWSPVRHQQRGPNYHLLPSRCLQAMELVNIFYALINMRFKQTPQLPVVVLITGFASPRGVLHQLNVCHRVA